MSTQTKQNQGSKLRGILLTVILIVMAMHGLVATYLYYSLRMDDSMITRPWLVTLMLIHSLANVIAAVGIWYWKMWAWKLYMASTVIALVVGLLSVGIWSAFYMVLPLAIVGWALRTKWHYFT